MAANSIIFLGRRATHLLCVFAVLGAVFLGLKLFIPVEESPGDKLAPVSRGGGLAQGDLTDDFERAERDTTSDDLSFFQGALDAFLTEKSTNPPQKFCEFLAEWYKRDPALGRMAFEEFLTRYPEWTRFVTINLGIRCEVPIPLGESSDRARGELDAFLEIASNIQSAKRDPSSSLDNLHEIFERSSTDTIKHVTTQEGILEVLKISSRQNLNGTVDWLAGKINFVMWNQVLNTVGGPELDAYTDSELITLIEAVPFDGGIVKRLAWDETAKQNNSRLVDLVLDSTDFEIQKHNQMIEEMSRIEPEMVTQSPLASKLSQDQLFHVARGVSTRSVRENLDWIESLSDAGAREVAMRGVVYGMLDANEYSSSKAIMNQEFPPELKHQAYDAVANWLDAKGLTAESRAWRERR